MTSSRFLHPDVEVLRLGPQSFLLYDVARDRRYQCGMRERWLLDCLNQDREPAAIREAFRRTFGRRLSQRELESFVRQLQTLELTGRPFQATDRVVDPPLPPMPLSREDAGAQLNHRFDWLVALLGWILHPFWLAPLLVYSWVCFLGMVRHADALATQMTTLFRGAFWQTMLLLVVIRAVATFPRELLIGMACRKHNGRVKHFGLHWWYRIIPYFLCEVCDPVKEERGRWTLLGLGLWYHLALFVASFTAWMVTADSSFLSDIWILATLVGGFGFLLRLNPFEQTNLYGMLCYRLEVEGLQPRALAETRSWLFLRCSPESLTRKERCWFRLYGLGVYLSRALIVLLLGLLLWHRFGAPGLPGLALIIWVWHRELSKAHHPS